MDDIALVRKVAATSFTWAIEIGAIVSNLGISNNKAVAEALMDKGADRAAGIVQKALFQRLLMWAMMAVDPVRPGDYHLRVAFDRLRDKDVFGEIAQIGNPSRLAFSVEKFAEAENAPELPALRHYRNKQAAHASAPDPILSTPSINDLLLFAGRISVISEALAQGSGVVEICHFEPTEGAH